MTPRLSSNDRARNARAAANDVAIADAALDEILRVGIDRVSLREVAQRAGLTHGAAYARYEDVGELLIDLWHLKLSGVALELLELCVGAVEQPSEGSLRAVLDWIREPRTEDVAMVEMLLVSRRMPIVNEETESFVKKYFHREDHLTEQSGALFARSLSLFGLAMVSVFDGQYFNDDQNYLGVLEKVLVAALRDCPSGAVASEFVGSHEVVRPGDDEDSLRAQLVYATFVVVSTSGYHEATISRIARRADCSPAAIYKLYRSKEELVLDSFRAILVPANDAAAMSSPSPDLSEILSSGSTRESGPRTHFAMETIIAGAHSDALRTPVGAYLGDPGRIVQGLGELDDDNTLRLSEFVRSLAAVSTGTQWMASILTTDTSAFGEFSEKFQVALLNEWAATAI